MKSNIKAELFEVYLNEVFLKAVSASCKRTSHDSMAGNLTWNIKGEHEGFRYNGMFITPMWEGSEEEMIVQLTNDEDFFDVKETIYFPSDEWTMVLKKDVARYFKACLKFLKSELKIDTSKIKIDLSKIK